MNWRTGRGRRAEGLAEGLLLGDERTLTECNATSQFDPHPTPAIDPERAGAIGNGQINPACRAGNQDIEEGERVQLGEAVAHCWSR